MSGPHDFSIVVDLDPPARALGVLRIASAMLALLAFMAIVAFYLQESHAPSGLLSARAITLTAAIAVFVVGPSTWFAINGMRPLFLLPILGLFAWFHFDYHNYMQRAGASYDADTISQILVTTLPLDFMLWAAFRGLLLTIPERAMTRPLDRGAGYLTVLRFAFGVWPGLKRSAIQTGISSLLIYASQIIQGLSIVAIGAIILLMLKDAAQVLGSADIVGARILDSIYYLAIPLLLTFPSAAALLLVSAGLRNAGRWISRQSFEGQVSRDLRPPILFLRAFRDDQSRLPQGTFLLRLLRAELGRRRLDHILVEDFSRFGPVVALGRPGERMRPFGAARVYLEDRGWQAKVVDLAEKSGHIVMVAEDSAGVVWEIETLLNPALRSKTIFLATQLPIDLRSCSQLRSLLPGEGPPVVGMFESRDNGTVVLQAARPSPETYIVALQAFFRRDLFSAA
jgi:hypothetical protein